jgi:peptidoglycan/LPS O-acetylase OafA/YrhL
MSRDKAHGHIPQLDGMRAVAVLMVLVAHVGNFIPSSNIGTYLLGARGVTIFFVLSGYLITSLALNEESKRGRLSFQAFYIRRTFRIFPLYYLVLLLYCFLVLVLGFVPDKREGLIKALPYYFTYLQEIGLAVIGPDKVPFSQSWSLGYEEKFYLVWPLIVFGFLKTRKSSRPYVASCLILFFAACGLAAAPNTAVGLLFPYYHILVGCLLALLKPRPGRVSLTYPFLVVILLSQFVAPWLGLGVSAAMLNTIIYTLAVAGFFAGILTEESIVRQALAWRPLVFTGKVSYGIYLIHVLCIHACLKVSQNPLVVLLLSAATSIAFAAVLYRVVESPLIAVGRRLSAKIIERPQAAVGERETVGV